jgi:hypothetical protein
MIDWISTVTLNPKKGKSVLIGIPTWDVNGKWKGFVMEVAHLSADGFYYETESDSYEVENVTHYANINPPMANKEPAK